LPGQVITRKLRSRPEENTMDLQDEPLIPSRKTIFLTGSLHDISLLAYDRNANRFAFFRHFITHGVSAGNQVIYAFFSTNLVAHFRQEIADRKIILYELRNGLDGLAALVREHTRPGPGEPGRVHIVADFSRQCNLIQVNAFIRDWKDQTATPGSVSGIVAFDIDLVDDGFLHEMSAVIPGIIVLTGTTNLAAFPAISKGPMIAGIVPQDIVESVVKHSLEQLILMGLKQPVTGFDILRDISDRFHVEVPIARVYSYLYDLENKGLLTTQIRGRAKIYVPTAPGRLFIDKRLHDIQVAHEYVLGYQR
jgi:two-component system, response regulator PdtaR